MPFIEEHLASLHFMTSFELLSSAKRCNMLHNFIKALKVILIGFYFAKKQKEQKWIQ